MGTVIRDRKSVGGWIRCSAIGLALAIGLSSGAARAATVLIDDFMNPDPADTTIVAVPLVQITDAGPGIIGGEREIAVEVIGTPNVNSAVVLVGHDSDHMENALQLATVGMSPAVATLLYDGVGNAGLGGIDLTDGGLNDRFLMQFVSSDALPTAGLDIVVTVTSPGGSSTATVIAQNSMSAFDVEIPFADLVGSASLAQVDSIAFAFNTVGETPNIDFEVSSVAAVPEPTGVFMAALGGLLLGVARIRRRQ